MTTWIYFAWFGTPGSVCLLVHDYPGLCPCFAGLDTLVPRVIELGVTSTSTVFEPRTTVSATTSFARFLDDAALRAYGGNGDRRSDGWCLHVGIGQHDKRKKCDHNNSPSSLSSLRE